jgi:hypothetical protein
MLVRQLHIPIGTHDKHLTALQLWCQERQQTQRWGIGPMQVVEAEHHRLLVGSVVQEAPDGAEEAEARLCRIFDTWGRR